MGRWQPNGRERLESAALDLFVENGYDETTVAQIADRAGLTRSTFFRHFADKKEVLMGGQDLLANLMADGIRATTPGASLADCLVGAFEAAGATAFTPERRHFATQRGQVVAANSELRERELLKQARIVDVLAGVLAERGHDALGARFGAELGVLALGGAFARWTDPDNDEPFLTLATGMLAELRVRARRFGAPAES